MCAIFGVFNVREAAKVTCTGLHAQQHRATDGAGIVTFDGAHLHRKAGHGLALDVFTDAELDRLHGRSAIGHLRYSTVEDNAVFENLQPIVKRCLDRSEVAIAHNGNITNVHELKAALPDVEWQTSIYTEIIVERFCRSKGTTVVERLNEALTGVAGSYSLLLLYQNQLIAVRDQSGNRPLYIGHLGRSMFVASETCAVNDIHSDSLREVAPGEIVVISQSGIESHKLTVRANTTHAFCRFEGVYYAHPTSSVYGENTSSFRFLLGRKLEELFPVPGAQKVVPVPDSANAIAAGYAYSGRSGQLGYGLLRNHYVGRTFILRTAEERKRWLLAKFLADATVIANRIIVLVDDSVVRMATLPIIVDKIWKAGAREVHVRIGSPPVIAPCFYGIDTPTAEELAASHFTSEEIRQRVTATSLEYLPIEALRSLSKNPDNYCYACFTGERPACLH